MNQASKKKKKKKLIKLNSKKVLENIHRYLKRLSDIYRFVTQCCNNHTNNLQFGAANISVGYEGRK